MERVLTLRSLQDGGKLPDCSVKQLEAARLDGATLFQADKFRKITQD